MIGSDAKLDEIKKMVDGIIKSEAEEDEKFHNLAGRDYTCKFTTPILCPHEHVDNEYIEALSIRWKTLQEKEYAAEEQFVRFACIATNVIEDVFQFKGKNTWPKLIRRGFKVECIEGISQMSKKKNKGAIVQTTLMNNKRAT